MATRGGTYNPVSPEIVEALGKICGADAVIYGDSRRLEKFSHDAVVEKQYTRTPDVAVAPSMAFAFLRLPET